MACVGDFFVELPQCRLMLCKACARAVWPDQVRTHRKGKPYCLPPSTTKAIAIELKSRTDRFLSTDERFELPQYLTHAIPDLPLYRDGLHCQLDSGQCTYVCRSGETIKEHWRHVHDWSPAYRCRGGGGSRMQKEVAHRYAEAVASVHCQRIFRINRHSRYIRVLPNHEAQQSGEVGTAKSLASTRDYGSPNQK